MLRSSAASPDVPGVTEVEMLTATKSAVKQNECSCECRVLVVGVSVGVVTSVQRLAHVAVIIMGRAHVPLLPTRVVGRIAMLGVGSVVGFP